MRALRPRRHWSAATLRPPPCLSEVYLSNLPERWLFSAISPAVEKIFPCRHLFLEKLHHRCIGVRLMNHCGGKILLFRKLVNDRECSFGFLENKAAAVSVNSWCSIEEFENTVIIRFVPFGLVYCNEENRSIREEE